MIMNQADQPIFPKPIKLAIVHIDTYNSTGWLTCPSQIIQSYQGTTALSFLHLPINNEIDTVNSSKIIASNTSLFYFRHV